MTEQSRSHSGERGDELKEPQTTTVKRYMQASPAWHELSDIIEQATDIDIELSDPNRLRELGLRLAKVHTKAEVARLQGLLIDTGTDLMIPNFEASKPPIWRENNIQSILQGEDPQISDARGYRPIIGFPEWLEYAQAMEQRNMLERPGEPNARARILKVVYHDVMNNPQILL